MDLLGTLGTRRRVLRQAGLAFVLAVLAGWLSTGLSGQGIDDSEPTRAHLQSGLSLLQAGRNQEASEEFRAAIRQNRGLADAYVYLGIAENQSGDFTGAAASLRDALRLDRHSEAAHYNLALSLLGLGKRDEAAQELQTVIGLDPTNAPANYNLGILLADNGRVREARQYLESARSARPRDTAIAMRLIDLYLKTGDDAGAFRLMQEVTTEDSSGTLSVELGKLLVDNYRFKEAITVLQEAQRLRGSKPEITSYLAQAYFGASQPEKVVELLSSVTDKRASWQFYHLRGLALSLSGQKAEAEKAFVLAGPPQDPSIHYAIGNILLRAADAKSREAGVNELREAIKLSPEESQYYLTLGTYYFDCGNLTATIKLLTSAIDRFPTSVQMNVILGLTELELHGPAPAEPYIEKAIALDPRAGAGYDLLGRCRMRSGDYPGAATYYTKAAELTPENDIYFRDAAIALDKLGDSAKSLTFAERSVKLKPEEVYNHYILGKLYSQLNRKNDAIRELERCVSLNPRNSLPYNLLAILYKREGENAKAAVCWRTLRALKEQDTEKSERTFSRLGSIPSAN